MQFRKYLENTEYDELLKWANDIEHQAISHPAVEEEFRTTGTITIRTLQQAMSLPEGQANFLQRYLAQKHNDPLAQARYRKKQEAEYQATLADDFYYHITDTARVPQIMENGLRPGSDPMFSNYTHHSTNRLFLTEKGGINFWKERVEQHAFNNTGDEIKVAVLRMPKAAIEEVEQDEVGSMDAKYPSYYTTQSIPPEFIEVM